jgi:putative transposase
LSIAHLISFNSIYYRIIKANKTDEVKKYYWKSVLWNESYFIASCGGVTVSILKKYIEQQDTPEDCPSAGH